MRGTAPTQVPAVEGYAEVAGGKLWYWDTGGKGEALVLCHPASQSSLIWIFQQPVFAKAGFRVIAYSRRGYYRSEDSAQDGASQVDDLAGLLDILRVKKAHVLGAAAGGITALGFAVAHPTRVISLVLAGTIFSPDEEEWRTFYDRLGIAAARRQAISTEFLELGPSYRAANPEEVARFVELEHAARPASATRQCLGAKVTWAAMKKLRVPALLLTGEADLFAPPPLQRMVSAHLPKHEMVTLREVGHAPYWEAPAKFNRLVLAFLRRQGAAGSRAQRVKAKSRR